jgi:hypothetical protein
VDRRAEQQPGRTPEKQAPPPAPQLLAQRVSQPSAEKKTKLQADFSAD